jgi:hypothetical protein
VRPGLALCLALSLTAPASAGHAHLPARVTLDGVAGVSPGLSPDAVARRWGVRLRLDTTFGFRCQTATVNAGRMTGYALFERYRFGSVVFHRGAVTGRGIRIGSTRAELLRAYRGRLTRRRNAYIPGTLDYFVRRARAPHWELRFDVSARGRVTRIAFGNRSVRYTEGCA